MIYWMPCEVQPPHGCVIVIYRVSAFDTSQYIRTLNSDI